MQRFMDVAQAAPVPSRQPRGPPRVQQEPQTELSSVHTPANNQGPQREVNSRDLRQRIDRRRVGQDARVSIERARERRHSAEGAYDPHPPGAYVPRAPAPARHPCPGGAYSGGAGCAALAPALRMVAWPPKFRPHLPEKYDGSVNPAEFLQIYITAILAAGGNEAVMANYFHVALTGSARSWLMNLPHESIYSWGELCRQFMANFESSYSRPGVEVDLHAMQ